MKLNPMEKFVLLMLAGIFVPFVFMIIWVAFCVSREPPFKIITDPVTGIEYISDMRGGLVRREHK